MKAELKYINQLLDLENKVFPSNRLSRRSMERFIKQGNITVITRFNKVIGSIIVLIRKDSSAVKIYSLAVDPDYQGQGIGKQLIASITAPEIRLEVREDNHKAIEFYKKQGFEEFGKHKKYYEDGVDALKMKKKLIASS